MSNIVNLFSANSNEINISRREILRYMQFKNVSDTSGMDELIDKCIAEFRSAVDYKASFTRLNIDIVDNTIDFGFMKVTSNALTTNLKGCDEVYIFAATTGTAAERLINKYNRISPVKALITDAIGSAAIEAFCDHLNNYINELVNNEGLYLRPRFSPGYGDFPLSHQKLFLQALDSTRKLNLTLTESLLMVPTKSVTAIIGISNTPTRCHKSGCEACTLSECSYRLAKSEVNT